MNIHRLTGKGLFVFSDPGGAKPLLALAESIKSQLSECKVISDRRYSFYKDFSNRVYEPEFQPAEEIEIFKPDFILTGTSYTSKIELEYIKAAKEMNVLSYSFVDHWTNVRERFFNNPDEIFPDIILLIDERARSIALDQGIDPAKLEVLGNPYHVYLENWQPEITRGKFLKKIGLAETDKKIAVYAPDPLSNVKGIFTFGFDEIIATEELMKIVRQTKDKFEFLFNPHPNQDMNRILAVTGEGMTIVPINTDVNTLIFFSDVVIGFFSNFLLEAQVMKKPVIRFFIKRNLNDPFINMEVGAIAYPDTIIEALDNI